LALAATAIFALHTASAHAAEVEVTARLDPQVVAPGGVAVLTIVASGGASLGRLASDPEFELTNLERASGVSRSEQFSFVNGAASRSLTLRIALRAGAAGEGKVTRLRVQSGDSSIDLPDQLVSIDANAPPPRAVTPPVDPFESFFADPFGRSRPVAPQRAPKVFARSEIEPREVYVGQQAIYTLYLYTQTDIVSVDPDQLPEFRGFWARDVPRPAADQRPRPEQVEVDGEAFTRFPLLQKALFPLEAKTYEIAPVDLRLAVRVPQVGLGGLLQQVTQVDRRADAVQLVAKSLPPAPANDSGAVGSMRLEATLDPPRLEVGQAATLSLVLAGEGNLQGVRDPQLPALAGVQVFPPQQESIDEVRGRTVRGRRTWKWVLVPTEPGSWTIAPVEMGFFDPKLQRYQTTASPALTLAATAALATRPAASAAPPASTDDASVAAPSGARSWMQWLPWVLAAIFGTALVVLLRRRQPTTVVMAPTAAATAPGDERSSQPIGLPPLPIATEPALEPTNSNPNAISTAGLKELVAALERATQEERPRAFAGAVEEVIRQWLDLRWNVPASTPVARWSETLRERGAVAEGELLRRLAEELRYLRYAPELGTHGAVRDTALANARRLLQN
jgi:hypothetical protein